MKTTTYYTVSNLQLFIMALMVGIISSALTVINSRMTQRAQLPVVIMSVDNKCVSVDNYTNGQAFTCLDVGLTLRNYRVKIEK